MQGQRVYFAAHPVSERSIDQLMLLHHRAAFKLLADYNCLEMITLPFHRDLCLGDSRLYQVFQFTALHDFYTAPVCWKLLRKRKYLLQTADTGDRQQLHGNIDERDFATGPLGLAQPLDQQGQTGAVSM